MEQKYKIVAVEPKNGVKRDVHHRMECSKWCEIIDLRKGDRAWIKYAPVGLNVKFAHTSIVEEVVCLDGGGIEIHTKNTVYILEELNGIAG